MNSARSFAQVRDCVLRRTRAMIAALGVAVYTGAVVAAPQVLTLAVADVPHTAPLLIAEAEGYFAAEGLKLKVIHCVIGRACLKHLLDGEAHFATVADTPIAFAAFSRKDFAIVGTIATSGREHRLVARGDRGIQSAADLKGKRIGMVKGTSGHYFADTFLLYNGLGSLDVTVVPLDPKDAAGPLVRGEVDASALFEPHGRDAIRRLGTNARVLQGPSFFALTFNLVSVPASVGASDEDVAKLLRAVQRGNALIRNDPVRARAIVGAALKIEPGLLAEIWNDFDFRLQLGQSLVTTLEAQARWTMRDKLVPPGSRLPDFLDLIRVEPLRRLEPRSARLIR
ncbi:MAG: ABC transporter substrate-binding protein [Proteobacteria bacterium]|nr:ABC transporter substrate-binding protein [Burkholderiales bacterium]